MLEKLLFIEWEKPGLSAFCFRSAKAIRNRLNGLILSVLKSMYLKNVRAISKLLKSRTQPPHDSYGRLDRRTCRRYFIVIFLSSRRRKTRLRMSQDFEHMRLMQISTYVISIVLHKGCAQGKYFEKYENPKIQSISIFRLPYSAATSNTRIMQIPQTSGSSPEKHWK